MTEWLLASATYVAPILYVAVLTIAARARTSPAVHWAGLLTGLLSLTVLAGWPAALLSAGLALGVFLLLVFTRLLNKTSTLVIPIVLASLPVTQWWSVAAAGAVAAVVSVLKMRKVRSSSYLMDMAMQTVNAMGGTNVLAGGLIPAKPDVSALPVDPALVSKAGVPLLAILGAVLCACAILVTLIGVLG